MVVRHAHMGGQAVPRHLQAPRRSGGSGSPSGLRRAGAPRLGRQQPCRGGGVFRRVGFRPVSRRAFGALGVDFTGDEHFRLRVFDVETGAVVDDAVDGLGYGLAWTADSKAIVYSRVDDSWRQWQIWLHRVGSPTWEDRLLFQENDGRFNVGHWASRDGRWIVVHSSSALTAEALLYDVADIDAPPIVVCPRRQGLDYSVEPAEDLLLIVHNANVADFEVAYAPIGQSGPEEWTPVLTPEAGERILGVDAFRDFAVIPCVQGASPSCGLC